MTEVAPYATDHDDDSKRTASSYCYGLPNQDNEDDNSIITAFIREIAPSYLNTINKMITYINEDYTMYFNEWEDDLPERNDETFLPDGLRMAFGIIENILDEVTRYMNQEFMNEEEIKPLKNRERWRREKCERLYQRKTESQCTTTLINNTALLTKTIKSNVDIPTQSNDISSVSCNLHSNRTLEAIKSPLLSSLKLVTNPDVERATNPDANFDRDNPSLLPNVLVPSSELKSVSYKVLSHRTANNFKATSSSESFNNFDANFDRDNPSLLPLILPAFSNALPLSINNNNDSNNNNEFDPYNIISPPQSPKDIKLKQLSSSSAPPLPRNSNNMNGLYNNNFVTDNNNNFVTDKIVNFVIDKIVADNNNPLNASEASISPSALPPSIELPSVLYNVLSNQTDNKLNHQSSNNISTSSNVKSGSKLVADIESPLSTTKYSKIVNDKILSMTKYSKIVNDKISPSSNVVSGSKLVANIKSPSSNINNNNASKASSLNGNKLQQPSNNNNVNVSSSIDETTIQPSSTDNIKSPSSSERVINSDANIYPGANFDRDNPLLSTMVKSPPPSSSSNDNTLQQQSSSNDNPDANFDRDNPYALSPTSSINNNNNNASNDSPNTPSVQSIKPPSMELPLASSNNDSTLQPSSKKNVDVPPIESPPSSGLLSAHKASPSLNHFGNISTNALNKNNNYNKVTITATVPVTASRTAATIKITRKVKTTREVKITRIVNGIKILGMIHTTKYAATENHATEIPSTSKISIAHEEARSKYAATENHIKEKWKYSLPRPKISITHEEASPAIPKFSSTRSRTSIAHEEVCSNYAATENHVTIAPSTRSKISIAHEEASPAIPKFSSTQSRTSIAHEGLRIAHGSNYTGNIDKYTAMENQLSLNDKPQSKNLSTHGIRDKPTFKLKINMVLLDDGMDTKYAKSTFQSGMDTKYAKSTEQSSTPIVNNSTFCSQNLQTVLKITNKDNNKNNKNNNNGAINNIMLLLLHQIIPIHPFIEYLQPEPEPPPLNSYFLLFLFLFIGKTKQSVVLFILKSLTLINRIQAMARGAEPLFGVYFFQGCNSLKKWTYTPLLRHSASPFNGACRFIYLEYAKISLYGPHQQRNMLVKINYGRAPWENSRERWRD